VTRTDNRFSYQRLYPSL